MPTKRLSEITSKLDRVFDSSGKVDDDEIKSHLSRYLCVLTSGYIEETLKIIIQEYVSQRTHRNISNYVSSTTQSITNLKYEKIATLLNSFNGTWREKFEDQISEEEKAAIDSVIANRHLIAHGSNVGVSYVRVRDWYRHTKSVVNKIQSIVSS